MTTSASDALPDVDITIDNETIMRAEQAVKGLIFSVDIDDILAAPRNVTPENMVVNVGWNLAHKNA